MTSFRLPAPAGSMLDRTRTVSFRFNGVRLQGVAGDTLASALLANGVQLVGRSFKLHRPRGIFSCGLEESTGLVDVGEGAARRVNQRATLVRLEEGLNAASVNCWPSVRFDLGALNGRFAALLPAGFYYKTFKWPSWHLFEPTIRRMAGFGRASTLPDPDRYEEIAAAADVLVIGGGPSGLSAAVAAAQGGADTWLLTSGSVLGGAWAWRDDLPLRELVDAAKRAGVRTLTSTLAFGVYDHGLVCAREELPPAGLASPSDGTSPAGAGMSPPAASGAGRLRERLWKIRARHIVAAAGAFERPMLFPNNDRPGVMLAGAAEKYARAYGVAVGRRVVVAANSDSAYGVADALRAAGIEVVALVDRRPPSHITRDVPAWVRTGAGITQVSGVAALRGCSVVLSNGSRENLECDAILSAGGHAPAVHLHSMAGGKLKWLEDCAMFVPDGPAPGLVSVGACAGVFDRRTALEHATEVGRALAAGRAPSMAAACGAGRALPSTLTPGVRGKQFIDLQNDVTVADVGMAARENYRSVEHLKRYTTTGMGTDQGKTSNVNALVLLGELTGRAPMEVGTTKFRPPFSPVPLGLFAGRRIGALYRPLKTLPAARWHGARGACFEQFGSWSRPAAYPLPGESLETAAQREAFAVRNAVGVLDGSPLGKIEIFGRDAARFLDLMYVGTMSTLAVGQARYGVLLNENGVIVDDGIVARLGEQHFWVNTTSAGVERTAAAFDEWLQCEYTTLEVLVTPVTSRWGNVTVAGPRAWDWLAATGFDAAFAPQSMRHMTMRCAEFDGMPLRVLRASFSGELGYEINLPADYVTGFLDSLWTRAAEFSAVPYGIEALEILRTEKGFIHVGTDTDGTTLPGDVGFGKAVAHKAENFVGRRSLLRPAATDPERLQLVALRPVDGSTRLPVGAQLAVGMPPTRSEGYVTSSYHSPTLRAPVALGMLARGFQRLGERIHVHHLSGTLDAVVVKAPFVDPEGGRVHG